MADTGTGEGQKDRSTLKSRSPNYPSLSLEDATAKAKALFEKHKRFSLPMSSVAGALDYKETSSSFMQAVATLRAFGLIDAAGTGKDRKASVSESAMKIILGHRNAPVLLKEAALKPSIFAELWERFYKTEQGTPPDEALNHYLSMDRTEGVFNLAVIPGLIANFKATIAFAKLDSSASIGIEDEEEDEGNDDKGSGMTEDKAGQGKKGGSPGTREFAFPLIDGVATLRVPHPMGEANFDMLTAILNAAKAALVGASKPADAPND